MFQEVFLLISHEIFCYLDCKIKVNREKKISKCKIKTFT